MAGLSPIPSEPSSIPFLRFDVAYGLQPGETVRIAFWTVVASSRSDVLDLVDKHHDANAFERAATLAWTQAQVQLSHLGVDADEASLFQRLAGHVLYADPSMRPSSDAIRRGGGGPAALWAQGISGDIPIVLVRIDDIEDIAIVGQLLRAHEYWRMKQLAVDLVILNERASSYVQDLQIALETMVRTSQSHPRVGVDGARGSVFVLRTDLISQETRALLPSVARVVLAGRRGKSIGPARPSSGKRVLPQPPPPRRSAARRRTATGSRNAGPRVLQRAGRIRRGWTGICDDPRRRAGRRRRRGSMSSPTPRSAFRSRSRAAATRGRVNSRENQLTPWSNDPVTDRPGEVIFLRDEDTGELWGPTALPIRDEAAPYVVRHGQGYSRFEHTAHGIELDLLQYVPLDDPIKISRLTIRNTSARTRRLSVTAYVEWVLGPSRSASAPFIVTEIEPETGLSLPAIPGTRHSAPA